MPDIPPLPDFLRREKGDSSPPARQFSDEVKASRAARKLARQCRKFNKRHGAYGERYQKNRRQT